MKKPSKKWEIMAKKINQIFSEQKETIDTMRKSFWMKFVGKA